MRGSGLLSVGFALAACQAATPPAAPSGGEAPSASAPTAAPAPKDTPDAGQAVVSVAASSSASLSVGGETARVESSNEGSASVTLGAASVKCEALHAAHAALTSCTLKGSAGSAFVGHGLSDDASELVCSRGTPEYQWEHGGGWDAAPELVKKLGAEGARVALAPGVEAWLKPDLSEVELSGGRARARFEIALDSIPASVHVTQGAGGAPGHAAAPLILDLTQPRGASEACTSPAKN